jgi:hypothetical protein
MGGYLHPFWSIYFEVGHVNKLRQETNEIWMDRFVDEGLP